MDACRVVVPTCSQYVGARSDARRRSFPVRKLAQATSLQQSSRATVLLLSPARTTRSLSPSHAESTEIHRIEKTSIGSMRLRVHSPDQANSRARGSHSCGSPNSVTRSTGSSIKQIETNGSEAQSRFKNQTSTTRLDARKKSPLPLPLLPEEYQEKQKEEMHAAIASQFMNSSIGAMLQPQSLAQPAAQPIGASKDVTLQREWSDVLQQVLQTEGSKKVAKVQMGVGYSSKASGSTQRHVPVGTAVEVSRVLPCNSVIVRTAELGTALPNEFGMSLLHQSSSCSLDYDSSTTLPSPRSTPASTPRSYVAFSAPVGKLFSWRQVAVHADIASTFPSDDSNVQTVAQEIHTRAPSKKCVPPLRLELLPTVPEPERL